MRVVVVGAGVVGVTTAYYLARSGHQVTVVEKEPEAATLASAGNAGLIAPGHSFAWASPTAPKELLRSLTVEDTALRVNPFKAPGMAVWGLRFLRECNAERAVKNTLVKLRLAQYSQRMLDQIAADERIDYDDIHEGILYLYRDPKRFEAGIKKMKLVQEHGQMQDVLDADGVVEAEPFLAPVKHKLAGAIYGVTDSSGEFTGYETTYTEHDLRLIRKLANDLLPDAAEYDKGTYRACNRPMTPDGPPILGQAGPDNLYINSGHGHMGFTMASGSSRIVADLIDGKKPDIPVEGLTQTSRP